MREPNLGITRFCAICGSPFWCEDGDSVCSKSSCQKEAYDDEEFDCNEEEENNGI